MKLLRKNKKDSATENQTNQGKSKEKLLPWKVLIVDDEPDVHTMTRLALKNFEFAGKKLQIFQAMSGMEARQILATEPDMAVALIDVVMETDDAGLQLVNYIRNQLKYSVIRLIIRTGQPGMAPEKEVIEHYDINDYKEKTELTVEKLYIAMRMALKSYHDLDVLETNRKALRKILDMAPEFYHVQSLNQFFHEALTQIINLCNLGEHSLISAIDSGLILTANNHHVVVQSGTGRFAKPAKSSEVKTIIKICSDRILKKASSEALPADALLIPFELHNEIKGFVYLENALHLNEAQRNLIRIMAYQCATALENLQLYLDLKEANRIILQLLTVSEQTRQEAERAHHDAELASRVKNTFLANMSHELRTPLNSILGYSKLLTQDKSLNSKQQQEVNIIQHSGNYLLTLVNDILELAKMETGGIQLDSSDFLCNPFLEEIVKLFQIQAEQKGISFFYQKLSPLPTVIHADKKRLRQILINLLGNAVKFTKRGRIIFKVGIQDQPQNLDACPSRASQKILFEVEDTGIGIATEELEKIFLPFQQREMGNQLYKVEGSGVGLSITKKLVEMMGGELQVKSTLGQGSTFWTVLVLSSVPQMEAKIPEEKTIIIGYQGSQRKILVIDDEPEYLVVFTDLLKPLGFEVIEANDGQEGLNKIYTYHPDLIITDLVMPIMDGFELIRQLRKMPKFSEIPIITVSASFLEVSQQTGSEVSHFDFLSKPIRAEMLLNILQKHLGLTWIYEEEKSFEKRKNPCSDFSNDKVEEKPNLVAPSPEQAAILFDLTMAGNLDGIIEQADKLEQQDKQLLPFACKIRQLAEDFKVKEIRKLVRQYID